MIPFIFNHIVTDMDAETCLELTEKIDGVLAPPEVPAEVHNHTKPDGEACMRAVRAVCGG